MVQRLLLILGIVPIVLLFFLNVEETLQDNNGNNTTPVASSSLRSTPLASGRVVGGSDSEDISRHSLQLWFVSLDVFMNQLSVGFSSPLFGMYMLGTSLSWFFADMLHCE
jgi:hypothetical protein